MCQALGSLNDMGEMQFPCQVHPQHMMLSAGGLLDGGRWFIPLPDELDGTCWFQGLDACSSGSKILGNDSISSLAEDSHADSMCSIIPLFWVTRPSAFQAFCP